MLTSPVVHSDVNIDFDQVYFLPIWINEQNVISSAYDIHLIPFKLHWVCMDDAYAHVCFEAILITFIFIPSWTHFGP
jgi:hypothetical protein